MYAQHSVLETNRASHLQGSANDHLRLKARSFRAVAPFLDSRDRRALLAQYFVQAAAY